MKYVNFNIQRSPPTVVILPLCGAVHNGRREGYMLCMSWPLWVNINNINVSCNVLGYICLEEHFWQEKDEQLLIKDLLSPSQLMTANIIHNQIIKLKCCSVAFAI